MRIENLVVVVSLAIVASAFVAAVTVAAQDPAAVEAALSLHRPTRRLIQQGLSNEGFDAGAPDGLFGPRTRAAIRAWQAARDEPQIGYLDVDQVAALRAAAVPRSVTTSPEPEDPTLASVSAAGAQVPVEDTFGCDSALLFSDEQLGKRSIDLRKLCGFQLFNECRPLPVIIRTEDMGPDTDKHIRAVAESHLRPAQIYGTPPAVGGLLAIEVLHHYGGNLAYEVVDPSKKGYWVNVKFIRRVFEPVSEQWGAAETWRSRVWRSSTYTANTSGPGWHPILQLVSDGVGEFTNSYLRVNEPAC